MAEVAGAIISALGWPQDAHRVLADLRSPHGLAVIRLDTPNTQARQAARQMARTALREVLGAWLQRDADTITLTSRPGQGLTVDLAPLHVGLSLSHAPAMSVAAIRLGGAVGVDLMQVDSSREPMPDWELVATDYLGPQQTQALRKIAPGQRALAFAQSWSRLEAGLKCLGQPLSEWTPALAQQLAQRHFNALELPPSYVGSLCIE